MAVKMGLGGWNPLNSDGCLFPHCGRGGGASQIPLNWPSVKPQQPILEAEVLRFLSGFFVWLPTSRGVGEAAASCVAAGRLLGDLRVPSWGCAWKGATGKASGSGFKEIGPGACGTRSWSEWCSLVKSCSPNYLDETHSESGSSQAAGSVALSDMEAAFGVACQGTCAWADVATLPPGRQVEGKGGIASHLIGGGPQSHKWEPGCSGTPLWMLEPVE